MRAVLVLAAAALSPFLPAALASACSRCDAVNTVTSQACVGNDLTVCAEYLCTTEVLDYAYQCYECQHASGAITDEVKDQNIANVGFFCESLGYTVPAVYSGSTTPQPAARMGDAVSNGGADA